MTRLIQFANNAVSNLTGSLTTSGTTLTVTAGEGAKFPALTGTQYFMATLIRTDGSTEIVKVTARSTDTLTIVRAAEPVGGSSTAYAFSSGDRIELRMTSGGISGELDRLDAAALISPLNKSANYTILEADKTSLVRVTTTSGAITITLPSIAALADDFDVVVAKVTNDANAVTLARSSSDLINGNATYALTAQWQSVWLIADRSTNTWTAINSGASANVVVDAGTGSGVSTITLSGDPGSKNNTALFIGSVYQQKSTYSISGTTLTAGGVIASGVTYEVVWTTPNSIGAPSDLTVTTAKIVDAAVTTAKVADGAITSAKIADGTIVTADLADGAITSAKIADGTIVTADLADNAITSAKIADGTIVTADLADGAITSAKIADGTIATGDLADGAVTTAKLTDSGVSSGSYGSSSAIPIVTVDSKGRITSATTAAIASGNSSKATNGYGFMPNGVLVQWGTVSGTSATWPIAFPTICGGVGTSSSNTGTGGSNNRCNNKTTSGATLGSYNDSGCFFVAVGY